MAMAMVIRFIPPLSDTMVTRRMYGLITRPRSFDHYYAGGTAMSHRIRKRQADGYNVIFLELILLVAASAIQEYSINPNNIDYYKLVPEEGIEPPTKGL